MRAVIYARYSSDNQREESIEGQLRECTAYCQKNEITIVRTYIDRALSAKTDNRPDFQRMIKDSAKGLFDVVLVWKLDRFARNRYDSARYYQIDPRTAPVVLEMFTRYDNGATMKEIRDYLNDTGVTTVRGKAIDLNFVASILHNRKFLGEYKYREIVIPNGIPAIVPQDLFDRVQDKLAKNKRPPPGIRRRTTIC